MAHPGIKCLICVVVISFAGADLSSFDTKFKDSEVPTITIASLVRNKQYVLPYFLAGLQDLDYPKDKITVWFYSDYNSDKSIEMLKIWRSNVESEYNRIYLYGNESTPYYHKDEPNVTTWTPTRFKHVMKLKQRALNFARKINSDYVLMVDADVVFTDKLTLKSLIIREELVVAPMLLSDGLYSNFWHGMSSDFTYLRTSDYSNILRRNADYKGCHDVPLVNSAVLIDLRPEMSKHLTYNSEGMIKYEGPEDDTMVFCISAYNIGARLKLCNDRMYGFLTIPAENSTPERERKRLTNMKLEALSRGFMLHVYPPLYKYIPFPETSLFGMCKIYMINLDRRRERRELMIESFRELGMEVTIFEAIDGKALTGDDLQNMGIELMRNYEDPYHGRPMKSGEIGCFLSHYNIWKEIVDKEHKMTLVMEDDVHFVSYFKEKLSRVLTEIKNFHYDLLYLGRKILVEGETKVTSHTVKPLYSYWTLGYVLTLRGAEKLLRANPLKNLLPVDEFLPIMFNAHPNESWVEHYPIRDLKALSASPLLMNPTHYTGMDGYISDTEDSKILSSDNNNIN